ncbi:hypothetical protein HZC20_01080 [Candidatus Peregrinibacteria bacterium]|nr:hypothetical protein [Candidatus Peregrinibacteria bacterium]
MLKNEIKIKVLMIGLIIIGLIMMIFLKVYFNSMWEYQQGEGFLVKKDYENAVTHYERSIKWYTPLNKYVNKSIDRLWEIGNILQNENNDKLALEAYISLRGSLYAVRSFYTPHKKWIEMADGKIADLIVKKEPYSEEDKKKTIEQRRREEMEVLKIDYAPNPFWAVVLEIGFIGWIGCAIGFIFLAFVNKDEFNNRKAALWGGLIITFYALWILGMVNA